jgi:hypothetical protein
VNVEDASVNLLQVGHALKANLETKSGGKANTQCLQQYADGLDGIEDGLGNSIRAHPGTVVTTSTKRMIFGAGAGTTGTRSVATAIQRIASLYDLGWKTQHWMYAPPENCNWTVSLHDAVSPFQSQEKCEKGLRSFDFSGLHDSVGAMFDTPVFELFIDFFLSFPNAVWILTTRPSHEWALKRKSGGEENELLHAMSLLPMEEPCGRGVVAQSSTESLSRMFDLTNDLIRCMVPSERLLEVNFFSNQTYTMGQLVSFLGFPSVNKAFDSEVIPSAGFYNGHMCGGNPLW